MGWLYLIRHPHTQQDPARPASEWDVSDTGRAQIAALAAAPLWAGVRAVYTSPQLKTRRVGEAVAATHGIPHCVMHGLTEAHRDAWLEPARFEAAQRVFLEQAEAVPAAGWEPAGAALARFDAAMRQVLDGHEPGESLAVVTHASVLTLYVAHLRREAPSYEFWQHIGFATVLPVPRDTLCPPVSFVAAPYAGVP